MTDTPERRNPFYTSHLPHCGEHPTKPAGYVVKRRGELYRYACTEACGKKQAKELWEAWRHK
jgi:hypothetical protein